MAVDGVDVEADSNHEDAHDNRDDDADDIHVLA